MCEILKDCPKGTKLYTPLAGNAILPYDELFKQFDFIDGKPFGIREEE